MTVVAENTNRTRLTVGVDTHLDSHVAVGLDELVRRPACLAMAHGRLDKAVYAACGWPEEISDEEILRRLLALNYDRTKTTREGVES